MLTIQNIDKIRFKTLGKKNFYVTDVKEIFELDALTNTMKNHRYQIDITNRKFSKTLILHRSPILFANQQKVYKLSGLQTQVGWDYLTLDEIKNIDKFLDRLRYFGVK